MKNLLTKGITLTYDNETNMFNSIKPYHIKFKKKKSKTASKLRKLRAEFKAGTLKQRAERLEQNLPKSEVWFRELYKEYIHEKDEFNSPFAGRIPDLINKEFKYIVEIDGSIHNHSSQIKRDANNMLRYFNEGFKVFRVKAYSIRDFNACIDWIKDIRKGNVNN